MGLGLREREGTGAVGTVRTEEVVEKGRTEQAHECAVANSKVSSGK